MKKYLQIVIVLMLFIFCSCNKKYTCHCVQNTPNHFPTPDPSDFTVEAINKKKALEKCKQELGTGDSSYYDCNVN